MIPASSYDPDTLKLLCAALDDAWLASKSILGASVLDPVSLRSELAKRIIAAANAGERDPARLKLIALNAIEA